MAQNYTRGALGAILDRMVMVSDRLNFATARSSLYPRVLEHFLEGDGDGRGLMLAIVLNNRELFDLAMRRSGDAEAYPTGVNVTWPTYWNADDNTRTEMPRGAYVLEQADGREYDGYTALQVAIALHRNDFVWEMIGAGADVGGSLRAPCWRCDSSLDEHQVEDVNPDIARRTLLHTAICYSNGEAVEALLLKYFGDRQGRTGGDLHVDVRDPRRSDLDRRSFQTPDGQTWLAPHIGNERDVTVLHELCRSYVGSPGAAKVAQIAIDTGLADVDAETSYGERALARACRTGHFRLAACLVRNGAGLDARVPWQQGFTMLHVALMTATGMWEFNREHKVTDRHSATWVAGLTDERDGLIELVKALIGAGEDVDAVTPDYAYTPLHLAARLGGNGGGVDSIADLLVHAGADVNALDAYEETALDAAKRLYSPLTGMSSMFSVAPMAPPTVDNGHVPTEFGEVLREVRLHPYFDHRGVFHRDVDGNQRFRVSALKRTWCRYSVESRTGFWLVARHRPSLGTALRFRVGQNEKFIPMGMVTRVIWCAKGRRRVILLLATGVVCNARGDIRPDRVGLEFTGCPVSEGDTAVIHFRSFLSWSLAHGLKVQQVARPRAIADMWRTAD